MVLGHGTADGKVKAPNHEYKRCTEIVEKENGRERGVRQAYQQLRLDEERQEKTLGGAQNL